MMSTPLLRVSETTTGLASVGYTAGTTLDSPWQYQGSVLASASE